jgi:hypothetical protein
VLAGEAYNEGAVDRRFQISASSRPAPWDSGGFSRKPTFFQRLRILLSGIILAVLAIGIVVAAFILGSVIAVSVGILLFIALILLIVRLAMQRTRSAR